MVLAEHPLLGVEDTLGVQHVLDVADQIALGVGAQGRLARARQAEEDRHVVVWAYAALVLRSISPWTCSASFCTVKEPSSQISEVLLVIVVPADDTHLV